VLAGIEKEVQWWRGVGVAALKLQNLQAAPAETTPSSASALLKNLIDYAGLFPPASLDMDSSVANYDLYLRSKWNWILGRFIVPVARLNEFEMALDHLPARTLGEFSAPWRLSVLPGSDLSSDVTRILAFNSQSKKDRSKREAIVESIEIKVSNCDEIEALSKIIPPDLETYFEIVPDDDACFAAIASNGRRAKIRTGGETADKFPAARNVVKFIRQCAAARIAFKATAGLHHPLRSVHNFTYQSQSASGVMHGFINVFLTAAFVKQGLDDKLAVQLLEEESWNAFQFEAEVVQWRGHRLTRNEMAKARSNFATSFGSCSFMEPIDDLRSLHVV
jgi:hypothetical protein